MNQEIVKFEEQKKSIAEQVKALVVTDQESYQKGASLKIIITAFKKTLEIHFNPKVSVAKEKYDEEKAQRDNYLKPAKELDDEIKDKLKSYEREMEKKAEEERRKVEAERQRLIDGENARRQAEAKQKAIDEAEVIGVDVAEVKVDKIEEATAEDVEIEQPLPTIDRVKGLGIRKVWKWKIIDVTKIPKQYWVLDELQINKEVRESKENTKIMGIEAYQE